MKTKITKAVIPAAGLGTRFLPVTKAIPKEMIPLIDRPMIHYIVEEAVRSGIEDIILVSAMSKESIEHYFDYNYELEDRLIKAGKEDLANEIRAIASSCNIITVYQREPLGLGHAVGVARPVVGKESFAVLLGDDLIDNPEPQIPCTQQLMNVFHQYQTSVVGVMEVPESDVVKYGIVGGDLLLDDERTLRVNRLIEKPAIKDAPSRWAIPGRYILDADVFDCIRETAPGRSGEIQLTDALMNLAKKRGLLAHRFEGQRFDTGDRLGYLDATLNFGLRRADLRPGLIRLMKKYLGEENS